MSVSDANGLFLRVDCLLGVGHLALGGRCAVETKQFLRACRLLGREHPAVAMIVRGFLRVLAQDATCLLAVVVGRQDGFEGHSVGCHDRSL